MKNGEIINNKRNVNGKGIALVEVIAALGIAMVVITAMVSLTLFTVRSSLTSKLLLQGTKTATREAELLRAFRDSSVTWDDFLTAMRSCTGGVTCCMKLDGTGLYGTAQCQEGSGVETVYRYFTASNATGGALVAGDQIVKIDITASWSIAGITKSTHLYTNLSNWK